MNTITIKTKVEETREIQVPYFGKTDTAYILIMRIDKYDNLRGMTVRRAVPALSTIVLESDFHESEPCSPAEFAAAFEEAHHNLRAAFEAIIEAQEGGKK
jgi:hypothetical protein